MDGRVDDVESFSSYEAMGLLGCMHILSLTEAPAKVPGDFARFGVVMYVELLYASLYLVLCRTHFQHLSTATLFSLQESTVNTHTKCT